MRISTYSHVSFNSIFGAALLDESKLDRIVAGDLTTPSGQKIFDDFSNQGTGGAHPGLPPHYDGARSVTAQEATTGHGPTLGGMGNEGPWSAHVASNRITCSDC